MKYYATNTPLKCYMTQSTWYKNSKTTKVKGVLWHSTGANNPNLSRYVQPSDNAADKEALLSLIGVNVYKNDWNHINLQAGVHAFIGRLRSGQVAAVNVGPWERQAWGCGNGYKGSCNDGWIQFEICEDDLTNKAYFEQVYREACELTAYLCAKYNLDPFGTVDFKGLKVPVILCHADSYKLGLGSNHGDVLHWFSKFGKTMEDVRNDVAKLMGVGITKPVIPVDKPTQQAPAQEERPILRNGNKGESVKELQTSLNKIGYSCGNVDGSFGGKTQSAVKALQENSGLEKDGVVGAKTWKVLDNELNSKTAKNEYKIKITAALLYYRAGPHKSYAAKGTIAKNGIYTISETRSNWGKLKSGVGWVCLDYATKL